MSAAGNLLLEKGAQLVGGAVFKESAAKTAGVIVKTLSSAFAGKGWQGAVLSLGVNLVWDLVSGWFDGPDGEKEHAHAQNALRFSRQIESMINSGWATSVRDGS